MNPVKIEFADKPSHPNRPEGFVQATRFGLTNLQDVVLAGAARGALKKP